MSDADPTLDTPAGAGSRARRPPSQNPHLRVRPFGPTGKQPLDFYLFKDVVEELAFASGFEERPVATAILTGGFGHHEQRGFIEISGFTGLAHVEAADELYATLRPLADAYIAEGPTDPMVGMFVSARGCGAKVTEEMARVHFSLFNIPFQPLVVYDPETNQLSLNARGRGTKFFNAAIYGVGTRRADARSGSSEEE